MAKSKSTFGGDLYTLTSGNGDDDTQFIITKWDSLGFEILSQYGMSSPVICSCPAAGRDTCRHRQMLSAMLDNIDTGKFYRYDDGRWAEMKDGKIVFEPLLRTQALADEPNPISITDLPRPAQAMTDEAQPLRRRV